MKKLILALIISLVLSSCYDKNSDIYKDSETIASKQEPKANPEKQIQIRNHLFYVVELDSCEYIFDEYKGELSSHHQNCRFCKARTKKNVELIIEQLKQK